MGTTVEKLNYLIETKNAIKTALINKGADVNEGTPFRDYASVVDSISASNLPEEALNLTGTCSYRFAYDMWNWFIETFGKSIKTQNLIGMDYAFYYSDELEKIPFELNCDEYTSNYNYMFYSCSSLKELPQINGVKIQTMEHMFEYCRRLRTIPDDFESWFADWSPMERGRSNMSYMFRDCYSLRSFPVSFLKHCGEKTYSSNTYFNYGFLRCYALDELSDLPIPYTETFTYGNFAKSFDSCHRVKNITFAKENGLIYKKNWRSMHLELTTNVGYADLPDRILNYNSGITADKEVVDDATYQALKNDPDWFTCKKEYSRYNKISAINTINTLPDTSEYLASAGGQNTIYFVGAAGSATDGGAINTMTEEEVAVAAAKGWTVTFA